MILSVKPWTVGICGLYERKLKKLNPATQNITYDIGVLNNFIDGLANIIALFQKGHFKWMPFHHVIKDCDSRRTFTRPWSHWRLDIKREAFIFYCNYFLFSFNSQV